MLTISISSLFSHPKTNSHHTGPDEKFAGPACQTLKRFEQSLKSALAREGGPLCADSQPKAECTTASLLIVKKCLDVYQIDRKCLQKVYESLSEDNACFCGGLINLFEMINSVDALLCNKNRVRESRLFIPVELSTHILHPFASTCAPPPPAPAPESCRCGVPQSQNRIVGGQAADKNEYPWQVALIRDGESSPFCGGTILSDDTVLTAAHCRQALSSFKVVVGEHDYSDPGDGQVSIAPCSWLPHPSYNPGAQDNDFALIRLSSPLTFSSAVMPVCLPEPAGDYDNVISVVTGWGTTAFQGSQPVILHEALVTTMTNAECTTGTVYRPGEITDNMVCAGGEGRDACQGDSGGPLITLENNLYYSLIGVVSWGAQCGRIDAPGVYARVTRQLVWITDNIQGNTCAKPTS